MREQVPPPIEKSKPYKGPESYQVEDADVFYGRDREADQLIAKILSSRFTLVHAQSGAGKTSLLNARIIPGLETRGWGAFRILLQNDPVESVRAATLRYTLPHPEAEKLSIEHAVKALTTEGEDITLDDLLQRYDHLEVRDPRRRSLIAPIELATSAVSVAGYDFEPINPVFSRLLRSSIDMPAFVEHVTAIQQQHSATKLLPSIHGGMRANELLEILSQNSFLSAYNKLHNELNVPSHDLSVFFEHLMSVYGRLRAHFSLVLILDQFEELFTRFIDPGVGTTKSVGDMPDWRLRWEFFKQMEKLYGTDAPSPIEDSGETIPKPALPICYVISMRDEYIAQLAPIRRFVWGLEDRSYHLRLLEKEQATAAIQKPAELFGYTYASNCFESIIQQLTKEDRYVEPAHLQLVCEKLWNEQGRELAKRTNEDGTAGEIPLETFEGLGETAGILKSFFQDFLTEIVVNEERLETLEILEPLVTASGTRNIVERDQLINAPLRDGSRRERLLNNLVNRTIVRTERRLGGYFVEITHEFLIGPILDAMREAWSRDPEYSRYRLALRTLERLQGSSLVGINRALSHQEFITLHNCRDSLHWNKWNIELMLRSAIALSPEKELLKIWVRQFEKFAEPPSGSELFAPGQGSVPEGEETKLTLAELRALNSSNRSDVKLTSAQLKSVLRSQLTWAVDTERDDIRFWTERMRCDVK